MDAVAFIEEHMNVCACAWEGSYTTQGCFTVLGQGPYCMECWRNKRELITAVYGSYRDGWSCSTGHRGRAERPQLASGCVTVNRFIEFEAV